MKFNVVDKKDNPLMKRKDVKAVIGHEGKPTPSRYDILQEASGALKANKDNIIINKVFGLKGMDSSEVKITVYENKADIPKALSDKMKRRTKAPAKKEEPAKEEKAPSDESKVPEDSAPKEEKAQEPKTEEKKEENKADKKEEAKKEAASEDDKKTEEKKE